MKEVQLKRQIQAPPEEVFDRTTDFANAAQVVRGIEKVEMLTDGPVGVGTRFRETRIMFGREATEEMELTTFDRPRRYELFAESHGSRYETTFDLHPIPEGTELVMTFRATPLSFFAKLMGAVMGGMMAKDRPDRVRQGPRRHEGGDRERPGRSLAAFRALPRIRASRRSGRRCR